MTAAVSRTPRRAPVATVTGAEIRAARALLKLSQKDLSRLSSVSCLTIVRIEAADGPVRRRAKLVGSIVSVLSRRGVEFLSANRLGVGVRLKPRRVPSRSGKAGLRLHSARRV